MDRIDKVIDDGPTIHYLWPFTFCHTGYYTVCFIGHQRFYRAITSHFHDRLNILSGMLQIPVDFLALMFIVRPNDIKQHSYSKIALFHVQK